MHANDDNSSILKSAFLQETQNQNFRKQSGHSMTNLDPFSAHGKVYFQQLTKYHPQAALATEEPTESARDSQGPRETNDFDASVKGYINNDNGMVNGEGFEDHLRGEVSTSHRAKVRHRHANSSNKMSQPLVDRDNLIS